MFISIHAPTNGATNPLLCVIHSICFISIHAPTNGATNCNVCFGKHICISIHAPTNGATALLMPLHMRHTDFNPRSDERSDKACKVYFDIVDKFQSTLRRTERRPVIVAGTFVFKFQSTLRRTERQIRCWL